MVDELLEIIKAFDSNLELKYNKFYIGLAKDGKPSNFVIFRPKKNFLRLEPRLDRNVKEARKRLSQLLKETRRSQGNVFRCIQVRKYLTYKKGYRMWYPSANQRIVPRPPFNHKMSNDLDGYPFTVEQMLPS